MVSGLEELGIVDDTEDAAARAARVSGDQRVGADVVDIDNEVRIKGVERALQQVGLFEGLLPVHMQRIAKLAQELRIAKGQHVFDHGDAGDGLFLILEGAIRISRNVAGIGEEALAVLRNGMYFGEMSIVDDAAGRSADAIVHEDAILLKLPKNDLRDLMFVDRELAYELLWRFVRTLAERLRESNDRLLMLSVSSKF